MSNDWMDEAEKREQKRRAYEQLQHDIYHAPANVKKAASIAASAICIGLVLLVLAGILKGIVTVLGSIF